MNTEMLAYGYTIVNSMDRDETLKKFNNMTSKEYYNMSSTDRFTTHITLGFMEFMDSSFSEREFLNRVNFEKHSYKYKYSLLGEDYFFASAKEVENFIERGIGKIWIDQKKGQLDGYLSRINEVHVYDSNNNLIDTIVK